LVECVPIGVNNSTFIHRNVTRKLCAAILNRNVIFFSFAKSENRRVEQVLSGGGGEGWDQWEGRRSGERMWEGEYSANSIYTCM
jgi:hypothetical protein